MAQFLTVLNTITLYVTITTVAIALGLVGLVFVLPQRNEK